jgi:hypothetical protein
LGVSRKCFVGVQEQFLPTELERRHALTMTAAMLLKMYIFYGFPGMC